jgi:hypothetical protein
MTRSSSQLKVRPQAFFQLIAALVVEIASPPTGIA